jgi:hypothetical protein
MPIKHLQEDAEDAKMGTCSFLICLSVILSHLGEDRDY